VRRERRAGDLSDLPGFERPAGIPAFSNRGGVAANRQHGGDGAPQWLETPSGEYAPTGRVEPGALFVSTDTPELMEIAKAAVQDQDLRRVAIMKGFSFGVGIGFMKEHLPMIGYLAGPTYLLNYENGGMDKLDLARMDSEIRAFAEMLGRLDRLEPAAAGPPND
jgi:hypothetical protein